MYKLLQNEDRLKISPDLQNPPFRVISDDEKVWVLKYSNHQDEEKRDILGFLLGKDFCNVTETRLLSDAELEQIKQFANPEEAFTKNNAFLRRLAQSYSEPELVCKTIEEAVARELVFSTLTRRRDAHVDNRAYALGIPVFYDFHVAFLGEEGLADLNTFFSQTSDWGRAGRWRLKHLPDYLTQFTRGGLDKAEWGAFQYVNDIEKTITLIKAAKETLKEKIGGKIDSVVSQAQFNPELQMQISSLLKKNLENIDTDINKMLEVIMQR